MLTDKGLSTEVTKEDRANGVKDEFGAIYSSDGKRLLKGVDSASYCIKPGTQVICDYAFDNTLWHLGSHNEDDTVIKSDGLKSVSIPDSVTHIGRCAFSACRGLTSISIPDAVTYIGIGAFSYCTGLVSINIPDSVTHIEDDVFRNCEGLTNIIIPDSITRIGSCSFSFCIGLTSVTIPNSVTHIGIFAFSYCIG